MPDDVRGFWSGTLTVGLVSIPVELFPAVRSQRPSLRMLSPEGVPLSRVYFGADDAPLSSEQIVRGAPVEEGFVVLSDEELDALEPERSRDIHLRRFVPREAIGPAWLKRSYFLAPASESTRSYAVLAATMEKRGHAGIATFVMRGTEYLVAIFADDGILRAETLRFADELRSAEDVGLADPPSGDASQAKSMRAALKKLEVKRLDEDEVTDPRAEALRELVEEKLAAGTDVVVAPNADEETSEDPEEPTDLVAVLKARLKAAETDAPAGKKKKRATDGEDLASRTKDELYERAQALDIDGRSRMTKAQLIASIEKARAA